MNETALSKFDELHVISDLHMGGRPGFQILREGKRLANYIRWVGRQRADGQVGLVLNGDIIDSLAEDIVGYVAADQAESMMTRIFNDQSYIPVWDALSEFVSQTGRRLVMIMGNHDIELALSAVQRMIEMRLAGSDAAARGRILFSAEGAGYSCLVGPARVFCTHGNEKDSWNCVDYGALFDLARKQNAGIPFDPGTWHPNAGTRLVKDIMNDIKRKYAWIDLLKPETKATVGVLVVLDPEQIGKISRGIPILWDKIRGSLRLQGLLGADESSVTDPAAVQSIALDQLLGPNLLESVGSGHSTPVRDTDEMLLEAEASLGKPRVTGLHGEQTLGWGQLVWDRLTGVDRPEALRRALKDWLQDDRTFEIAERDTMFQTITSQVGAGVDFIVTGHTHLERAIKLNAGRCYFNCGTWIRLFRFTDAILDTPEQFGKIFDVLMDGSMQAIDGAEVEPGLPLLMNRTSAVAIKTEGSAVVGELVHVEGDDPVSRKVVSEIRRS
ncbi:MAG: metallophosphoesterase [Desulfobacteraceae bacterium]|nr:metallophosphoesterase [Desulfobacteraceae bacterium]